MFVPELGPCTYQVLEDPTPCLWRYSSRQLVHPRWIAWCWPRLGLSEIWRWCHRMMSWHTGLQTELVLYLALAKLEKQENSLKKKKAAIIIQHKLNGFKSEKKAIAYPTSSISHGKKSLYGNPDSKQQTWGSPRTPPAANEHGFEVYATKYQQR